jgi:hypothetical protein
MRSFDKNTQNRLFQALNESTAKTSTGRKSGSWQYTGDLPTSTADTLTTSAEMANPKTQIAWGKYKQLVDPTIDYALGVSNNLVGGLIPNIAPVIASKYGVPTGVAQTATNTGKSAASIIGTILQEPTSIVAIRQLVKNRLALKYLGNSTKQINDLQTQTEKQFNLDPERSQIIAAAADHMFSTLPIIGGETTAKDQTDPVMKAISEKIPELTKIGVDPLDWATQMMGADDAAANADKMGVRARSTRSAGGYLLTGQQRGIY